MLSVFSCKICLKGKQASEWQETNLQNTPTTETSHFKDHMTVQTCGSTVARKPGMKPTPVALHTAQSSRTQRASVI